MVIVPPLAFRRRRGRARLTAPAALVLVGAVYDASAPRVTLTFDRTIDVAALDGGQIIVVDGAIAGALFAAQGTATLIDPATVEIGLVDLTGWSGPGVRLNAGPGTGIVAASDGGTWAGVANLLLPFP
jgi:hypothetical protein